MKPRLIFTLLHRWAGLTIAAFIFFSGITGAIISWDHEIDELINSDFLKTTSTGPRIPPLDMLARAQAREPQAYVGYIKMVPDEGDTYEIGFQPRQNPATGKAYELGFNRIYYDPVSGAEVGRRERGAVWPINRANFVSFLYRLHYTLCAPQMWGIDRWGQWLLGIVASIWTIDCFVGFYLTLPARNASPSSGDVAVHKASERRFWRRWWPSWKIKVRGSPYRINFDIHRAVGLWTWVVLFTIAFTGFSMNLSREVFMPALSLISRVTPNVFNERPISDPNQPVAPKIDYPVILDRAEQDARARGWSDPAGTMFYAARYGIYGVIFFAPGDERDVSGVGPPILYYDGQDGHYLGDRLPWKGTTADLFVQAQFPLHSGRILGLPGRILISLMGLLSAALSVTGVVIWARKRRARNIALAMK
ncbi:putative iron-regulated membrane protein [Nitrobacteraceae bacterium AZCC 1564]